MISWKYYPGVITVCIIGFLVISGASAHSLVPWTESGVLYSGQGTVHQIQAGCDTEIVLCSPYGAAFDLYVMKSYDRYGSCPGMQYIKTHYDRAAIGNGRTSSLYLEPGSWCVVVYARTGGGEYQLESRSTCPTLSPPYPDSCYQDPCCNGGCQQVCSPYKTDVKTGYLYQGQSRTTGYSIPGDRNYIEWILTGSCGEEIIPMSMMSGSDVSAMRTRYCGTDFDLYIYEGTSPRSGGFADFADIGTGSGAYVGISYPQVGSTYYAQVYAKNGSGTYTLTCRTYTCSNDVVMMMESPQIRSMMYTASSVALPP